MQNIVSNLGLDAEAPMVELEALGKRLLCSRCPPGSQDVMDIHELMEHYADADARDDFAKWARAHQPWLVYHYLPAGRPNPCSVPCPHSATDLTRFAKLLSPEAVRKHRRRTMVAFETRNKELKRELDSVEGVSTHDTRLCRLCPTTSLSLGMSPAEVEVHLVQAHGEEPDVAGLSVRSETSRPEGTKFYIR